MIRVLFLLLFAVTAYAATPGTLPRSPLIGAPGVPTLAQEDTIPIPSALLPVYEVKAPRVSLDEILKRVAEGEAHRDSLMKDQSYTLMARITYLDADDKAPTNAKTKLDYASKVYKKAPDKVREIPLKRSTDIKKKNKKDDNDVEVTASPGMREQIVSFAFEPRTRAKFNFHIDDRALVAGHVVYKISFTPKSQVDNLPEGRVWVDTND